MGRESGLLFSLRRNVYLDPSGPGWVAHALHFCRIVLDNEFFPATILQLTDYYGVVELALMSTLKPRICVSGLRARLVRQRTFSYASLILRNGCSVKA